jgi:CubicO group peptidase (beta-lactamase class C family)
MTRLLRVLGILATLTPAAWAQPRAPAAGLRTVLDTLVPALLAQHRIPGVAIGVVRSGAVEWTAGYGWADLAQRRPVTRETRFNVGSTSKPFTAWAVMALAAAGRLELDAPVNRYLRRWQVPEGETGSAGVTIRRVLSHTAGLSVRGYHGVFVPGDRLPTLPESLNGYAGSDGALRITGAPGSGFAYSSGGYTLLTLLLEDLTGERFDPLMRRLLFEPLGMTRSGYEWTAELQRTVATPYKETGEPWPHYQFAEQGSGGLYTTVEDLARFVAASVPGPRGEPAGRGVLPPDSLARMLTPAEATQGAYGLGYKLFPVPGGPILVSHDGSNEGWRAIFFLNRHTGDGIVILTNSDLGGRLGPPIVCSWAATTAFDMSGLCATVRR